MVNSGLQDTTHVIKQRYPTMTRSLRMFADFVIAEPVIAARSSIHSAAKAAGVSSATANRFIRELGYQNYASFRDSLIQSLASAYEPVHRMKTEMARAEPPDRIAMSILQEDIENLQDTISLIDPQSWEQSVRMILGAPRIFIVGFDNGASLAQILSNGLSRVNKNVNCVSNGGGGFGAVRQIINLDKSDLVIAIAFQRYIKDTIKLAELAKNRGVQLISITDNHRSPLASICSVNHYVSVRRQFASISNAAILALIEALIGSVLHATPEATEQARIFTEYALPWIENP